jgi:hypothetical protein
MLDDFNSLFYSCGNSYAFDVLSTVNKSSTNLDVFLGGVCDLRHLIETTFQLIKKRKETSQPEELRLRFTFNDINFTNLAHSVVVLYAIQKHKERNDCESFEDARAVADLIMLWASPRLYKTQKERMDKLLSELDEALKSDDSITKQLTWLKVDLATRKKLRTAIHLWQKYTFTTETLEFHGKYEIMEKEHWQTILQNYMNIESKDLDKFSGELKHGFLRYSSRIESDEPKNAKPNQVNNTLFSIPTLEYNVYETSCMFRSFKLDPKTDLNYDTQNSFDKYFDGLVSHLSERFTVISRVLNQNETSKDLNGNVKIEVSLDYGDILDALDIQESNQAKKVLFDSIDCSNLGEYVDPLCLLLSAFERLKCDNQGSSVSMHFMRSNKNKNLMAYLTVNSAKKALEASIGLSLDELEKFLQIKLLDIQIEAGGVYFNTVWTRLINSQVNAWSSKKLYVFIDNLIGLLNTGKYFSASSLARVFTYMLRNTDSLGLSHETLFEALNAKIFNSLIFKRNSSFEEFVAVLYVNLNKSDLLPQLTISNQQVFQLDKAVSCEYKLKVKKNSMLTTIKLLKLNEFFVRLRVSEGISYFFWYSFEIIELTEATVKVRIFAREPFLSSHKKLELLLEVVLGAGEFEAITEPVKLNRN